MEQYVYYTDGTYQYRDGVRLGVYVIDRALTDLGFYGVEDIDWTNLRTTE